jgi:hypothetical protein
MKQRSQDILAGALIVAANLVVFGYRSSSLGFYADDAGFLPGIHPGITMHQLIWRIGAYVTGRNLHIVWQYLVTVIAGGSAIEHLPAMHYTQVAADATSALLLFLALRLWRVGRPAAFVAAIAFSFYPVHDETHFWLSALPMNIMSTIFVLALVCLSKLILDALSVKQQNALKSLSLLVAFLLIFLCSMFTYDQAVPAVMAIVTLLAAAIFYRHPGRRIVTAGAWCFCLAIFVGLVIWKVREPGGGPDLSHATIGYVLRNYQVSVHIWLSLFSVRTIVVLPFARATPAGIIMAFAVAVAAVVAIWFLMNQDKRSATVPGGTSVAWGIDAQGRLFNLVVLVAGICFYLLAYLPACLWSLSPRHSYLPSVGIATMVAGLLGGLTPLIGRPPFFKVIVLLVTGILLAGYISRDLIDKELWITAFEMRKSIYRGVADRYASDRPTDLLLSGFPMAIAPRASSLAFLADENSDAPSIMTSGKFLANAMSTHPIPSRSGYFIRTEDGRWAEQSFVHVLREDATVVLFEGINGDQINTYYDIGKDRLRSDQFYLLTPIAHKTDRPGFFASVSAAGYDVDVPAVPLKQDEVLALVGYSLRDGRMSLASHSTPADIEGFTIPADVSDSLDGGAHAFHLEYQVSMPSIDSFRLYIVDGKAARLVAETPVK